MAKKEKKYSVKGIFEGKRIDTEVGAYSMKQAKYFAMNKSGFYGSENWKKFSKSRSVKVRLNK